MTRTISISLIYLAIALVLDVTILGQFKLIPPEWLGKVLDGRGLLPLAGILIGLLRGEIQGMILALFAACLYGFTQPLGNLGASIEGFTLAAFLAGFLARWVQLYGFPTRWFLITVLLVVSQLSWWIVRRLFWPDTSPLLEYMRLHASWPALILTGLLGSFLYQWAAPTMRLRLYGEN